MADFVTTLATLTGDAGALADFAAKHLAKNSFDFNTIDPMPPELDIESNSMVETGHAALYGDWRLETGRFMFKEPADAFGFPFPLESREQVIRCLQSFDCADLYLVPAKTWHENVQKHGHGDWYGWCLEHWGSKWNADEVRFRIAADRIDLSFVTAGAYPKPIMRALSQAYPQIAFHVRSHDEQCRRARDFVLTKGRETKKLKRPPKEVADEIVAFRRRDV